MRVTFEFLRDNWEEYLEVAVGHREGNLLVEIDDSDGGALMYLKGFNAGLEEGSK